MTPEQEITHLTVLADYETKTDHEEDFKYLVEHMATKEDLIDLEERLTAQLTANLTNEITNQLITHIAPVLSRLDGLDIERQEHKKEFDRIMTIGDRIFAPIDDLRVEAAMAAAQYRRQVDWNHKVAEKVNVPFDY